MRVLKATTGRILTEEIAPGARSHPGRTSWWTRLPIFLATHRLVKPTATPYPTRVGKPHSPSGSRRSRRKAPTKFCSELSTSAPDRSWAYVAWGPFAGKLGVLDTTGRVLVSNLALRVDPANVVIIAPDRLAELPRTHHTSSEKVAEARNSVARFPLVAVGG